MDLAEKIKKGLLTRVGNRLYSKEELKAIDHAELKVDDFELQQMSKKLTLKF